MGVPVPRGATNHLQNSDAACLLVFRRDDRVVGWTTIDRTFAECWPGESDGVYTADEASYTSDAFPPA